MSLSDEATIGSRGDILAKKLLREKAGLHPGDKVLIIAIPGELKIRKIYSINELFDMPIIATGSAEEIENEINEESIKQERSSADE